MKNILLALLVPLSSFCAGAQKAKDSTAIKKVLEKDAATWRSGDVKAHAECWSIKPYTRSFVSLADGTCYDVPPENIVNPPGGRMGNGGFAVLYNFTFSIQKKHAWVSHDEVSVAADGSKSYSHEIRLLEKIKGQWKLVGQSIHIYKPG